VVSQLDAEGWELQGLKELFTLEDGETLEYGVGQDGEILTGLISLIQAVHPDTEVDDPAPTPPIHLSDNEVKALVTQVDLYDFQVLAIQKALVQTRGLIEIPTGGGKTEVAIGLANYFSRMGSPVLFLSGSRYLTEQAAERFRENGMQGVGLFYEGEHNPSLVTCATVQTLYSGIKQGDEEAVALLRTASVVIGDEIHHLPSTQWATVCKWCHASYRYGISATLFNDPEKLVARDLLLVGLLGPVLLQVPLHVLVERGILPQPLVYMIRVKQGGSSSKDWHTVQKECIVHNSARNSLAVQACRDLVDDGDRILVCVNEVEEHGFPLLQSMSEVGIPSILVTGGSKVYWYTAGERQGEEMDVTQLRELIRMGEMSVIASPVLNEGVNVPEFSAVLLLAGGKSSRMVLQRMGRGMRKKARNFLPVIDFWDEQHYYTKSHSSKRYMLYQRERILIQVVEEGERFPLWSK